MMVSKQHPSQQKDWNIYNLQKKYHQSGGILYKQSVLTSTEYNAIINDLQSSLMNDNDDNNKLTLKEEDESSSFATNRIGAQISNESEIYRVLQERRISYISIGHRTSLLDHHTLHLKILGEKSEWELSHLNK